MREEYHGKIPKRKTLLGKILLNRFFVLSLHPLSGNAILDLPIWLSW